MNDKGEIKDISVIAIDLGGSSGRIVLGGYDGHRIKTSILHRFETKVIKTEKYLYWDLDYIMSEIKFGLKRASNIDVMSLGVDTWGVDFSLLSDDGKIVSNPHHYRDLRTKGFIEKNLSKKAIYELYLETGNQVLEINTLFQLLSSSSNSLKKSSKILMMPDLINYLMTGFILSERSIASTTQMYDFKKDYWSEEVLQRYGIPMNLMPHIVDTGDKLGCLSNQFSLETSLPKIPVIMIGHDSQSALVSVPASSDDFVYISSGTWSIMGTETNRCHTSRESFRLGFSHERAYGGKVSLHKNITGLWILQECVKEWSISGNDLSYEELEREAEMASAFNCFIDVDHVVFSQPGNMISKIKKYCKVTKQEIPLTCGEIVRCIYESLAMKYRMTFEEIEKITKKSYSNIYIVGGGSQSEMLCKMTASACNVPVIAGPIEATALGNIGIQLISSGLMSGLTNLRSCIRKSCELETYYSSDEMIWEKSYKNYLEVMKYKEEK